MQQNNILDRFRILILTQIPIVSLLMDIKARWRLTLRRCVNSLGKRHTERAGEQLSALASPAFSPVNEVQKVPMDDIMREIKELRKAVLKAG